MKLKVAVLASFTSAAICCALSPAAFANTSAVDFLHWDTDSTAKPTGFWNGASYQLCFVPDDASCHDLLVSAIDQTRFGASRPGLLVHKRLIAAAIKRTKHTPNSHQRRTVL